MIVNYIKFLFKFPIGNDLDVFHIEVSRGYPYTLRDSTLYAGGNERWFKGGRECEGEIGDVLGVLGDIPARFVIQIFMLTGMSDMVFKGEGSVRAIRAYFHGQGES